MNTRTLQIVLNVVTLAATIVVNGLANALPIGGRTTGEISDSFPILFVPAGYVFSIWGLIYLSLAAFAVYQALPAQRADPRLAATGWWVVIGNLANASWILFWHYGLYFMSVVAMLTLLASLLVIYVRINAAQWATAGTRARWLALFPFSLYLGWISVATVANVSTLLSYWNWDGFGLPPEVWAALMIAVAAGLSLAMSVRHRDAAYAAVIIWALIGIAVKQAAVPTVLWAALVGIAAAAAGLLWSWRQAMGGWGPAAGSA